MLLKDYVRILPQGKEGERKSESRALGKERLKKDDRCLSKRKQEPFLFKISL